MLTDEELKNKLDDTLVFARVLPKHKLRLVKAYKEKGEIVSTPVNEETLAKALELQRQFKGK